MPDPHPAPLAEAYRLLCAANLAYGVTAATGKTGLLEAVPPVLPSAATVDKLMAAGGFGHGPRHAHEAAGRFGIDAFLYEETDDAAILAFRGTLPVRSAVEPARAGQIFRDWLNNTQVALVEGAPFGVPGYVHEGYAASLENLWNSPDGLPRVWEHVARATGEGKRFLVTGHSKGGALALLAALRLAETGEPGLRPAAVHTFGAPRAGNGVFAAAFGRAFENRAWRFEYQDDPVPHFPPTVGSWFALREAMSQAMQGAARQGWSQLSVGTLSNCLASVGGYESAGSLQFVDWSGRLRTDDTAALRAERLTHIARILVTALAEINRDHLPMQGYGYMDFLASQLPA